VSLLTASKSVAVQNLLHRRQSVNSRMADESFWGDVMSERTERAILNHLIETCKDAGRGFRYAADHVKDSATKSLFLAIASERERFAEELLPHAQRLGGPAPSAGTTAGALHRGWMSLMDALTGHDEEAIIAEAERGEAAIAAAYREALEGMLPPTVQDLVERQYSEVSGARYRIRNVRA
jgi:uncharacterized protein (TIGR02284 family)